MTHRKLKLITIFQEQFYNNPFRFVCCESWRYSLVGKPYIHRNNNFKKNTEMKPVV